MADVFTEEQRSQVMSRIRGKGNRGTEIRLVELMRAHKITGWRRGSKLPGRPDFVFFRARLIVFVDGCFWHGCPKHGHTPKSGVDYWQEKIERNKKRDLEVTQELQALGWRVLRIWEHSLREKFAKHTISRLKRELAAAPQDAPIAPPPPKKRPSKKAQSKEDFSKMFKYAKPKKPPIILASEEDREFML